MLDAGGKGEEGDVRKTRRQQHLHPGYPHEQQQRLQKSPKKQQRRQRGNGLQRAEHGANKHRLEKQKKRMRCGYSEPKKKAPCRTAVVQMAVAAEAEGRRWDEAGGGQMWARRRRHPTHRHHHDGVERSDDDCCCLPWMRGETGPVAGGAIERQPPRWRPGQDEAAQATRPDPTRPATGVGKGEMGVAEATRSTASRVADANPTAGGGKRQLGDPDEAQRPVRGSAIECRAQADRTAPGGETAAT